MQGNIAIALRIALSRSLTWLHQVHESTVLIFDEISGSPEGGSAKIIHHCSPHAGVPLPADPPHPAYRGDAGGV